MCGAGEGISALRGSQMEGPRTASSSSEERAALTGLSSAPRLAGDGVGAMNICKSLAVALLLCCLDQAGSAGWHAGPRAWPCPAQELLLSLMGF